MESLEREKKNATAREKGAKTTVKNILGDLREKNLINEELKKKLDLYTGKMKYALWISCTPYSYMLYLSP